MFSGALSLPRRPPRQYGGRRRARTGADGCGCTSSEVSAAVMAALGMTTAAKMHQDPSRKWSARDWLAHIDEEESKLLPALRFVGAPAAKIQVLEGDHDFYLPLLLSSRALPAMNEPHSIDAHATLEDALIEEHQDALYEYVKTRVLQRGRVAGGTTIDLLASPELAPPKPKCPHSGGVIAVSTALAAAIGYVVARIAGVPVPIGLGVGGVAGLLAGSYCKVDHPTAQRPGGGTYSSAELASRALTNPPAGAPLPRALRLPDVQAAMNESVDEFQATRDARDANANDATNDYAKKIGSTLGPTGLAMGKLLAWGAKAAMALARAFSHDPNAQQYIDDSQKVYAEIGALGLAPPAYGPIRKTTGFVEDYKDDLYDTKAKLWDPARGAPFNAPVLELGRYTIKTSGDERVASVFQKIAVTDAGEIRGEGLPWMTTMSSGLHDGSRANAGADEWSGPNVALLAGTVAAVASGVPIAGPVSAALASVEGFATRHPGAGTPGSWEYNLAELLALGEAWTAAKAEAQREGGVFA